MRRLFSITVFASALLACGSSGSGGAGGGSATAGGTGTAGGVGTAGGDGGGGGTSGGAGGGSGGGSAGGNAGGAGGAAGAATGTCAAPREILLGGATTEMFTVDTATGAANYEGLCSGSTTAREVVYHFNLSVSRHVNIVAVSGANADSVLYLRQGTCSPGTQVACVDVTPIGGTETIDVNVLAGDYFLFVDSYNSATSHAYTVTVTTSAPPPPPANDSCATAETITLTNGMGTASGDTTNADNSQTDGGMPLSPTCTNTAVQSGRDVIYTYTLGSLQNVVVTATPTGTSTLHPALYVRKAGACESILPADELGCTSPGSVSPAILNLASQPAGTYFVWVDSAQGTFGPFNVSVTASTPLPADSCQSADALTSGVVLDAQTTVGFFNDYKGNATNCAAANSGPDRVYTLSLPSMQEAVITVTPDAGFDTSLTIVTGSAADCDARLCTANANTAVSGQPDVLTIVNKTGASQTLFATVDSASTSGGVFSIGATVGPVPTGEFCAVAGAAYTATTTLSGQTTLGYLDDYGAGAGCAGTAGPDRVYAVTIPAGQRLTARVSNTATWTPSVNIVADTACDVLPRACLSGVAAPTTGVAVSTSYVNETASPQSVFVVVDSPQALPSTTSRGTFDLTLTLVTPLAGDLCSAPTVATAPSTLSAQTTTNYANDYGAGTLCAGTAGLDRVYSISIPAGQRLTTLLHPTASWNLSLNLIAAASCGAVPRTCLAGVDVGAAGVDETLAYINNTAGALPVEVVVDSPLGAAPFNFDITFTLDTPPAAPPGETCSTAESITAGTLSAQTTVGYNNDYSPSETSAQCTGYTNVGLDRVYSISVPTGQTLTATVAPSGANRLTADPSVYLLANVAACVALPTSCLAGADLAVAGGTERVTYVNSTGGAVTVLIVVDSYYGPATSEGNVTFDLTTTVQ